MRFIGVSFYNYRSFSCRNYNVCTEVSPRRSYEQSKTRSRRKRRPESRTRPQGLSGVLVEVSLKGVLDEPRPPCFGLLFPLVLPSPFLLTSFLSLSSHPLPLSTTLWLPFIPPTCLWPLPTSVSEHERRLVSDPRLDHEIWCKTRTGVVGLSVHHLRGERSSPLPHNSTVLLR